MPEILFTITGADSTQFVQDWAAAWGCTEENPSVETCVNHILAEIISQAKTAVVNKRYEEQKEGLREDIASEVEAGISFK